MIQRVSAKAKYLINSGIVTDLFIFGKLFKEQILEQSESLAFWLLHIFQVLINCHIFQECELHKFDGFSYTRWNKSLRGNSTNIL